VNVPFGPRGLELMRAGSAAERALATLVASDEGEAVPLFERTFAADANWILLPRRRPAAGPVDAETVAAILARGGH